jgi:ATP-dependent protease ClpP protease subunit
METPINIENKAGKVRLKDIVTKGLIDPLMDQICTLYGSDEVRNEASGEQLQSLEIEIDSQGGSVAEGYRLYKTIIALRERGVEVIANVTDLAASMGSVIAMAATKVRMAEGSRLMIHEASATINGDADRMRHVTSELDQISQEIAGIYAARTGHPVDVIRGAMKRETWLGAEACVNLGFADETYPVPPKPYNPSILERLVGNQSTKKVIDLNATKLHYGDSDTETMSILSSLKPDTALVAKLEAVESDLLATNANLLDRESELSTVKNDLIEATNEVATLREQITEAKAELEQFKASKDEQINITAQLVAEFDAKIKASQEAVATAESKATPEAIQALVTDELSKAGHAPIESAPSAESADTKITREAFNALSPYKRLEFVRNGGTLK